MKTFKELLTAKHKPNMKLPVPLGTCANKVIFIDVLKMSPILIEGNNEEERNQIIQEIKYSILYKKRPKEVEIISINGQDEAKAIEKLTALQKEIDQRYEMLNTKNNRFSYIVVFLEKFEALVLNNFSFIQNILDNSKKVRVCFVLATQETEINFFFKLMRLCEYLLVVADRLVQIGNLLKITLQNWHDLYHQKLNENTLELPLFDLEEVSTL